MSIDWSLFIYVGVVALVMVGNTLLGVAKAEKYDEFNKDTLLKGLKKYGLILLSVCCLFVAGLLVPTFKFDLPVANESVTIIEMLCIVAIALIIKYLKSWADNIIALFGITDDELTQAKSLYDNGRGDSEEDIQRMMSELNEEG